MKEYLIQITTECPDCCSGSCCQDGVELSKEEIRQIVALSPKVNKPWFKKADKKCNPEPGFEYETILVNNTCIFQDKDKRCVVYPVRPSHCREFPLEDGKLAQYYGYLCDKARKYVKK